MNVPLLDLKAQYSAIRAEVNAAIAEVMESQQFILGPKVEQCESSIAQYCRSTYAVGVSSGTDALIVCLMAENIGVGAEVITTPYSFFATAGSIARVGATPVFVDIDPTTYNLHASQISSKVTEKTRAIIPVHLYGQMADMDAVMRVAQEYGLIVIEDAAQAIGAEHKGRRAGTVGHYGCFSFFPSKNLGAAGDGGMVVTNDPDRADKLKRLRAHGSAPKYYHRAIGGNFRLDAIQAAVISAKLPHLDDWTTARQYNAKRYDRLFAESGFRIADAALYATHGWRSIMSAATASRPSEASPDIFLPAIVTDRHIFNQYVIRVLRRDQLRAALLQNGIATEVYYPVPMHLQDCFAYLRYERGAFPESEAAARETLALPVHPELTEQQLAHVVTSVRNFLVAEPLNRAHSAVTSP